MIEPRAEYETLNSPFAGPMWLVSFASQGSLAVADSRLRYLFFVARRSCLCKLSTLYPVPHMRGSYYCLILWLPFVCCCICARRFLFENLLKTLENLLRFLEYCCWRQRSWQGIISSNNYFSSNFLFAKSNIGLPNPYQLFQN